ncbi:MAG: hypothetical protein ACPGJS_10740 [Flammeovirgaceae bacterium]
MKITTVVLLGLFLFFVQTGFAQTTKKIIDQANANKERRESANTSNSSRTSSSSDDDYEGGDVGDFLFLFEGIVYLFHGIGQLQGLVLNSERDKDIKRITSLELQSQYGAIPTDYQISSSRIQANWGLFSASLRYYHQFENRVGNPATYNTLDAQLLQLNVLPFKHFNARLGIGIMKEYVTDITFPERTLAVDIYPTKRLRFNVEGRFVRDGDTETQVRREWNVGTYYQIGKGKGALSFHGHVNAMHARYYESVDIWMVSGGLSMQLE